MNIDKFKSQHLKIFECIRLLRQLAQAGVAGNAQEIARTVVTMSSLIKLHLSVEDTVLYPALRTGRSSSLTRMGEEYQEDMKAVAKGYDAFARKWNTAAHVAQDPDGFRVDANTVLKRLHARIRQEDMEFYPAIEAI